MRNVSALFQFHFYVYTCELPAVRDYLIVIEAYIDVAAVI
jgi:hypothetical protein